MRRPIIFTSLTVIALSFFAWSANQQGVLMNTDMNAADQSAYMNYAKRLAETNFKYVGGRNRMPLYPAIMAMFYSEGMSDEAYFRVGKTIGIVIALLVALIVFLQFRSVTSLLDASVATFVTLFTVFAFKAPYFQVEILYYGISLILFHRLLLLIHRPSLSGAVIAGIIAGIAHLTKASVIPAILLTCCCLLLHGILNRRRQSRGSGTDGDSDSRDSIDASQSITNSKRPILAHVLCVLILLGCFLTVIFPYIQTSKARFGQYFYNVNSTFYIWCDSWEEVCNSTRAHGDRKGWPDMPADDIPSFRKYMSEHSLVDIAERFANGFRTLRGTVSSSYGYAEFFGVYLMVVLLLFKQNMSRMRIIAAQTNPSTIIFVIGYFAGYLTLYAWYAPIASGNRFILSLFLPALLIILILLERAQSDGLKFSAFGRQFPASATSLMILIFLIAHLMTGFHYRVSHMNGGG